MRIIVTRTRPSVGGASLLGGIGIGAALMYYLDPGRGARRRGLLRDRVTHVSHRLSDMAGKTARDVSNRARGMAANIKSSGASDDDSPQRVEARVRSALGRAVSHPHAIDVMVGDGVVTLHGDVLAAEVDELLDTVRHVRGVHDINDELVRFESADGVPSLQGGRAHRGSTFELAQENWSPAARLLSGIAGGALTWYGAQRRDPVSGALALAGLALVTRAVSNRDVRHLVGANGGRAGIRIQKTVTIAASLDDVFAYMTDWEQFPTWMSHVKSVRASGPRGAVGERTAWEVDGPAGSTVAWDAETTRFEPNELVAWKSVEGEAVRQAGRLRFQAEGDNATRVHIELQYNPPAGYIGHAIAALFRRDPKRQMDDDMARLKTLIETGRPARDAAAAVAASDDGDSGLGAAG
jgi:uncharacterized membrane protein/osmotically-inducible protein OsmY